MSSDQQDSAISSVDSADAIFYNFDELLAALAESRELIVEIPSDQQNLLREGLQRRKMKQRETILRAGGTAPKEMLSFNFYPAKNVDGSLKEGVTACHIHLKEQKGIIVLSIAVPDKEF